GAQPLLLTLEPPWTPLFSDQKATLTCGDPGARVPTTWYIDGLLWGESRSSLLQVTLKSTGSHTYQCQSPGPKLSPPINLSISKEWLVLQVPVQPVLEGDELPLRCRAWWDKKPSRVRFFRNGVLLQGGRGEDKLLLSPAQQLHSGRYHCTGTVILKDMQSEPSKVTVQGEHGQGTAGDGVTAPGPPSPSPLGSFPELFSVPELSVDGSREPPEGSVLALACVTHRSPLRPHVTLQHLFYRDGVVVAGPQGSPRFLLQALALPDSGSYTCEAQAASVRKRSAPVTVTVRRVPVAGVTLVAEPPGAQVAEGDRLVLSCAVAAGTGPLAFSWHRQGQIQPLAKGPR
ncbi:FCRL3 protein, partial [Anseranas semipalmata]|nr:FCRL3 protein [Anseranas semipalmata]